MIKAVEVRAIMPNGRTFIITDPALLAQVAQFGENEEYYLSETDGLIPIAGMETHHLKNAILKRVREDMEKLKSASVSDTQKYFNDANPTLFGMVQEFLTRE